MEPGKRQATQLLREDKVYSSAVGGRRAVHSNSKALSASSVEEV